MLKLRYLFENFDLARLALTRYPHDAASLDKTFSHFRISANAVYPFLSSGRLCFLRLAPEEEKPLSHVQAELAFIQHLRQSGYPAMKPLPNDAGETCWLLDSPWGRWCVSAFEGAAGRPVEEASPTPDLLFALGASLGQLHELALSHQPCALPTHEDVMAQVMTLLCHCDAPQPIRAQAEALSHALAALPITPDVYGPLHYDFEPDNVFWDGEHICVIDFDDAMQGWHALDVEQALESLHAEFGMRNAACSATFLKGYRSVRSFTQEMENQRALMRQFIDLRHYARLLHCLSEDISGPQWLEGLKIRLGQAKKGLESRILTP